MPSSRVSGRWSGAPRARQDSVEIYKASGLELVIHYAVPGCVIAHLGNMTFCAWNSAPQVEHVEAFMEMAKNLSAIYPHNSNVSLIMRGGELPGSEARVALEALTSQFADKIHSVALVIDGDGFWASMVRSFCTGLHLLRGHGYRCKAFATPSEATPWLMPPHNADTGVSLSAREVEAACEAIYRRMRAEGAPALTG